MFLHVLKSLEKFELQIISWSPNVKPQEIGFFLHGLPSFKRSRAKLYSYFVESILGKSVLGNKAVGAGEVAQSVKCLHESRRLRSHPHKPRKKPH